MRETERRLAELAGRVERGAPEDGASARVERARLRFELGEYDAALTDLDSAEGWFHQAGDRRGLAEVTLVRGNVWLERAVYQEAARCFTAARAGFEAGGADARVAAARHNLGLVYWRIGDLASARAEFIAAADVFLASGDHRSTGNTYNSLGLIAEEEGELDAALTWYQAALPLLRGRGGEGFVANVMANTASVYERRGALDAARGHHAEALALRRRIGHRRGAVGSQVELARISLRLGDLADAEAELAAARPDAEALGLRKHLMEIDELTARLHAARGEWEAAWRAEVAAGAIRARLAGAETARRIGELKLGTERDARREAEAASRAKGELLAMVSHDIRSPLTMVVGAGELLAATPLDSRQRELVAGIVASGRAVVGLLDQLLDVARIEAGRVDIVDEPFDLVQLLDDVDAVGRTGALARGIGYRSERQLDGRGRRGDAGRVRQVLLNLVGNAVKFTSSGWVATRVQAGEPGVVFEVEDTGVGIPVDRVERIFEPYVQAEARTRGRFGGSGLGLAVARGLAERMGGTVSVRSTVGVGSLFRVELPLPAAVASTDAADVGPAAPVRRRVLVVEDEEEVAQIVGAMIEHLGGEVTHARSAEEALAAIRERTVDLALVDTNLPGMDGVRLTGHLHALAPGLRVVGLSGAAGRADRDRALAAGMADHLAKPVTFAVLQRVLGERL